MMQWTPSQKLVFDLAKAKLERQSWYRGVCMDNFPSHDYCLNHTDEAVAAVVQETAMWDADKGPAPRKKASNRYRYG